VLDNSWTDIDLSIGIGIVMQFIFDFIT